MFGLGDRSAGQLAVGRRWSSEDCWGRGYMHWQREGPVYMLMVQLTLPQQRKPLLAGTRKSHREDWDARHPS